MEIDRNKWFKYIKLYEEFNREIPEELKKVYNKLRIDIGKPTESFNKIINLNDYDFVDLKINLSVNFQLLKSNLPYHDRGIKYYSNININDILENKNILDLPVFISDTELRTKRLCSLLAHEFRHIYDIYTIQEESDMNSFRNDLYIQVLRKGNKNEDFNYFLHLLYLSLEHELVARNSMIYENFISCYIDYEKLKILFEQSYLYKSFEELKNFDYVKVINSNNIIKNTNLLIDKIGGIPCQTHIDIENFYNNWNDYFIKKSNEYLLEAFKVLKEISIVKESNEYKGKKVKDILINIYNRYIK